MGWQEQMRQHKELAVGGLGLLVALLLGFPLLTWSAAEVQAQPPAADRAPFTPQEKETLVQPAFERTLPEEEPIEAIEVLRMPEADLGRATLDLTALAQAHSRDEADNARWALVRRTPRAAQVYHPETGVDWEALRDVAHTGTILVPRGFPWSFNETFKQGPGYKEAAGILGGGHCALATVFRGAAVQAGLPAASRPHATPIPGYSQEASVNILWGRDDLVVHNSTDQDLYFVWSVDPTKIEVAVVPVSESLPLPPLPDWRAATIAMVYGHPGPGGWGSLGQTATVDHALYLARTFAARVDEWNGERPVVVAVNPNVVMAGEATERELYLYHLIAEARRQGYYVMLDVQPGDAEPSALFEGLMEKFLRENVWFDWDVEHTAGGQVDAAQINQVAATYLARRQAQGYPVPGVLGFYVFKDDQVTDPSAVQRQYDGLAVVPIFDGFGGRSANPASDKIAKTARVLSLFGEGPWGVMEFETRWGTKYDKISAQEYFAAYPDALIFASQ